MKAKVEVSEVPQPKPPKVYHIELDLSSDEAAAFKHLLICCYKADVNCNSIKAVQAFRIELLHSECPGLLPT